MRSLSLAALLVLLISACFYSCNKEPNGGVPIYVKMDSVILNTEANTQGVNSQNITDVWVQTDSRVIGTFELPAQMPILESGTVHLLTSGGIEVSGQSGDREVYPFYQEDTFTINAVSGQTYHHTPVFRYRNATLFTFQPITFEFSNGFDSITYETGANVKYGNRCGVITVTSTDTDVLATQINPYTLPAGQEIWLELDYKCDVPFYIGFNAIYRSNGNGTIPNPLVFVNTRSTWNKLYVKLSAAIASAAADEYQLYFEAEKPVDYPGGKVYLDNIKIVHF